MIIHHYGQSSRHEEEFESQPVQTTSVYGDGAPLDRVQYLEAKLILKPDRFKSVESFHEFGKIPEAVPPKDAVGGYRVLYSQRGPRPLG